MSAETWLSDIDAIVKSYREQMNSDYIDGAALLQTSIDKLRKLGINEYEAVRYLKPHLKGT